MIAIESPTAVRVAENLPLAQFAGTGSTDTGNAVDAQPILKRSAYKCSGNKLELSPPAGTPGVGTWVWTKP